MPDLYRKGEDVYVTDRSTNSCSRWGCKYKYQYASSAKTAFEDLPSLVMSEKHISFKNYVLDLTTGQLIDHADISVNSYLFIDQEVTEDAIIGNMPHLDKYMSYHGWDDNTRSMFMAMIGCIMTPPSIRACRSFPAFVGPAGSGKATIVRVLSEAFKLSNGPVMVLDDSVSIPPWGILVSENTPNDPNAVVFNHKLVTREMCDYHGLSDELTTMIITGVWMYVKRFGTR